MKKKNILALTLAALLTLGLTACGSEKADTTPAPSTPAQQGTTSETPAPETTVVTVGVVGANNDQWITVNELLKKENIEVKIVEFSEYKLPNDALNAGEIDLNAFQHKAYLNKEIADLGYDVTVLGDTIIAPLSLYSCLLYTSDAADD